MTRYLVILMTSVGLIVFLSMILRSLLRSRKRGMSIRMQIFLALSTIVGSFALALGLLVIDRVEARARRLAQSAAEDESKVVAALIGAEVERSGSSVEAVVAHLPQPLPRVAPGRAGFHLLPPDAGALESAEIFGRVGVEILDRQGTLLYPQGQASRALEVGSVYFDEAIVAEEREVGVARVVKPTIVIETMLADFAPSILLLSLVLGASAAASATLIGRAIAEPIELLRKYSFDVSRGERAAPPPRAWGREVSHLVTSIETMRKRLEGRPFVETFAADLSHELKNPVAAIRASAEVLKEGALDEREEAERFVDRILEAARRIQLLLEELLSLAKIEAGGVESLAHLDLCQLVQEVASECEANDFLRADASALVVAGDALWLKRALSNLMRNALLHTQASPHFRVERAGAHAVFITENAGEIPEHLRKSLFRRFVTTRGDQGGTGLGLAIARAVAEAHGGGLKLKEPGPPQVEFEFRIPLARA